MIKIKRHEMFDIIFNNIIEHFENNAKDLVLDGINFKGLENMSDIELIDEYKSILDINDEIEIIN